MVHSHQERQTDTRKYSSRMHTTRFCECVGGGRLSLVPYTFGGGWIYPIPIDTLSSDTLTPQKGHGTRDTPRDQEGTGHQRYSTLPPRGQTNTCENITFPNLVAGGNMATIPNGISVSVQYEHLHTILYKPFFCRSQHRFSM